MLRMIMRRALLPVLVHLLLWVERHWPNEQDLFDVILDDLWPEDVDEPIDLWPADVVVPDDPRELAP